MPSRRRILALSGVVLTGGCLSNAADDTDGPAGNGTSPAPEGTPNEQSTGDPNDDECVGGFSVSLSSFEPSELARTLDGPARSLFAEAVADGPVERDSYGQPVYRGRGYVAFDGAYYRPTVTEASVETVTAYELDLTWEKGQEAPPDREVVAFADLPAVDRRALEHAVPSGEGERGGRFPANSLSVRQSPVPYPDGGDDSRLVGADVTWVDWDGRVLEVSLGPATSTERTTYRYDAEQVAADDAAFREFVVGEYRIALEDLPSAQRDLLAEAKAESYRECEPPSDALAGLREDLPEDATLPYPHVGDWYVRYDGADWRLAVLNWVR